MKTALQDLIQWTTENAFNIEGQNGVEYMVIDHEEMRLKFDEWIEKEKQIIITAYKTGYIESEHLDYYPDKHSKEYYDELIQSEQD